MFKKNINEWGPAMWKTLHEKTYAYPSSKNKSDTIKYFTDVQYRIPCKRCRRHYTQYLLRHPIEYHVDSKTELVRWLVDLHNEINVENGKRIWTYKEVDALYNKKPNNLYIIIAEVVAIIIVLCVQ